MRFISAFDIHPQIVLSDLSQWPVQEQFKKWQKFISFWLLRTDLQRRYDFVSALIDLRQACSAAAVAAQRKLSSQVDAMLLHIVSSLDDIGKHQYSSSSKLTNF